MDTLYIKKLLRLYMSGKLPASDIPNFKESVTSIDDNLLDGQLESFWNEFLPETHNQDAFDTIKSSLAETIVPVQNQSLFLLTLKRFSRIAAIIIFPLLVVATVYLYKEKNSLQILAEQQYQIQSNEGERSTLILPDGTKVYLNSSSTVTYKASFAHHDRIVSLTGEAYFEVTKDGRHPFIVQTEKADIKVLGTIFNVSANSSDTFFETALVEGCVEITPVDDRGKSIILKPNQTVRFDKQINKWSVNPTDLWVETAWKRGDIVFRSQPLPMVVRKLEMFFGVSIQVEGSYPAGVFTGSFHEDEIYPVLRNLQQHYDFTFHKSGDSITLRFN